MRRRHEFTRHGFTLIELLASSVLTAMLMIALLSVMRSAFTTTRQADQLASQGQSTVMLNEQLRRDIKNARGIKVQRNEIIMHGFLGRDADGMPNYQTSFVGYRVKPAGLVRWQSGIAEGRRSEVLVWAGASKLLVEFDGVDDEAVPTQEDLIQAGGLPIAPTNIDLALTDRLGNTISSIRVNHHVDVLP